MQNEVCIVEPSNLRDLFPHGRLLVPREDKIALYAQSSTGVLLQPNSRKFDSRTHKHAQAPLQKTQGRSKPTNTHRAPPLKKHGCTGPTNTHREPTQNTQGRTRPTNTHRPRKPTEPANPYPGGEHPQPCREASPHGAAVFMLAAGPATTRPSCRAACSPTQPQPPATHVTPKPALIAAKHRRGQRPRLDEWRMESADKTGGYPEGRGVVLNSGNGLFTCRGGGRKATVCLQGRVAAIGGFMTGVMSRSPQSGSLAD
ncbi:hypothetical protein Bbelb_445290 [Branchiostoma belcheri]|nr:hypothetical protein Bbelb_445290 [Branchiostoma belcheri]